MGLKHRTIVFPNKPSIDIAHVRLVLPPSWPLRPNRPCRPRLLRRFPEQIRSSRLELPNCRTASVTGYFSGEDNRHHLIAFPALLFPCMRLPGCCFHRCRHRRPVARPVHAAPPRPALPPAGYRPTFSRHDLRSSACTQSGISMYASYDPTGQLAGFVGCLDSLQGRRASAATSPRFRLLVSACRFPH